MVTNGQILDALGDETRRQIVECLSREPSGVQQLADRLPVSRSAVSQHLKVLKGAGLVRDEARGTRRIYSVEPTGFEVLRAYLDRMWATGLASFKAAADKEAGADDD